MAEAQEALTLSEEILSDARRKAERAIKRAEREVAKILARGEEEAKNLTEKILQAAREEAERRRKALLAGVEIEKMRLELDAKDKEIASILEKARERMKRKDSYDCRKALLALASYAAVALESDTVRLEFSESDRSVVDEKLLADITKEIEKKAGRNVKVSLGDFKRGISAGVVASSGDRRRLYDNSLEGRYERLKRHLRQMVAKAIFGEEEK